MQKNLPREFSALYFKFEDCTDRHFQKLACLLVATVVTILCFFSNLSFRLLTGKTVQVHFSSTMCHWHYVVCY